MAKLSVWLLWLSSALALLSTSALGDAIQPKPLEQHDLKNPTLVSAWLKANGTSADRTRAEWFFKEGLKEKKRGVWGAAGKSFGASVLLYPTPKVLIEYADAVLHSMGEARVREKSFAQYSRMDMASMMPIYHSVLAADAVLNTLSSAEKAHTQRNINCLAAFIQSVKFQPDCPALGSYGLSRSVFALLGSAIQLDPLKDEADAVLIAAWLKTYGATADKAGAALLFKAGLKQKKQRNWYLAVDSFCESARYYPTPQALSECANAHLHNYADGYPSRDALAKYDREERERVGEMIRGSIRYVESIYRSALAADAVLNTLTTTEKKQTRQNADCLATFIKSGKAQSDCQPLQAYGLK